MSNLPFVSKLIVKVVSIQINDHLKLNNLLGYRQSAYKKWHNTETTLVKIDNDLLGLKVPIDPIYKCIVGI